jgi:sec-independent protein translocase protein TatA
MPIGIPELIIVLVIVLLVFGPKRLPQLGRQLGGGMREFKDSIQGNKGDGEESRDADAGRPELAPAAQTDVVDPTPDATTTPTGGRDESSTRSGG